LDLLVWTERQAGRSPEMLSLLIFVFALPFALLTVFAMVIVARDKF